MINVRSSSISMIVFSFITLFYAFPHEVLGNSLLVEPVDIFFLDSKEGIKLANGSTINSKEGWKVVTVITEYNDLKDSNLSIDLSQISITLNNKPILCSAYSVFGLVIRCAHGRAAEGSFTPKSNKFFYKKLVWKNNRITFLGLRRKLAFINIIFVVPESLNVKTVNWYGKELTKRISLNLPQFNGYF